MTEQGQRTRTIIRGAVTLALVAALYEIVARSGFFPAVLLPTIPAVLATLYGTLADGSMVEHAAFTLYRVLFGFGLAVLVGVPLGIMMARFRPVESFFLPLISALTPASPAVWNSLKRGIWRRAL